jgi:phage N-6-adenine-methyltransferase
MSQGQISVTDELYTSLDAETRIIVQQRTGEIKTLMRRTAQDIIEIGQKLIEVKARLGHGLFGTWLRSEFEWSERTAQNFMNVAEVFKSATVADLIPPKALYLLAASSTPEAVREEALQRAELGERITYDRARAIIREYQQVPSGHEIKNEQRQVKAECATASVSVFPTQRESDIGKSLIPSPRCGQAVDHASEPPPVASRAEVMLSPADAPISETPGYDSDEWYTPAEYIEAARAVMGDIDLDPASCTLAQEMIQARSFFTKKDNGLTQPWHGRVWLNPPYSASMVQRFVDKLCGEYDAGRMTEAVVLVNNATDTAWFHSLLARFPACVLRRRVPFWRPGFSGGGARQGQVIFYLGPNADRFRGVFSRFGVVVSAWPGVAATGEET